MRTLFAALLGLATTFSMNTPASASTLSWSDETACPIRQSAGAAWLPYRASLIARAEVMDDQLAGPVARWRFTEKALGGVSHGPASGLALQVAFDATHDLMLDKRGLAKPLYQRRGCRKGFASWAGKMPKPYSPKVSFIAPKDTTSPRITVLDSRLVARRLPSGPFGLPGPAFVPGSTGDTGTTDPLPPTLTPLTPVTDEEGETITEEPLVHRKPPPIPEITPVPLPAAVYLLAAAVGLLFGFGRRKT